MNTLSRHLCLLALFIMWTPSHAGTSAACKLSKLTDDDARILLYVTPDAIAARKEGGDVGFEENVPDPQHPAADFYSAMLYSEKPLKGDALGNGILGYYLVDKRSATVTDIRDMSVVKGRELMRVQKLMRHGHCLVEKIR